MSKASSSKAGTAVMAAAAAWARGVRFMFMRVLSKSKIAPSKPMERLAATALKPALLSAEAEAECSDAAAAGTYVARVPAVAAVRVAMVATAAAAAAAAELFFPARTVKTRARVVLAAFGVAVVV